jgi:hypothetical protein
MGILDIRRIDPIYDQNEIGRNPEGMICLHRDLAPWPEVRTISP